MKLDKKAKRYEEQVVKQFLAYTYLKNANQSKYGSILADFITQQS
jgi:hypothetical protein